MAGTKLEVSADAKGVWIHALGSKRKRTARIIKDDVIVTNGVIHYIDMPISSRDGKISPFKFKDDKFSRHISESFLCPSFFAFDV